MCKSGEKQDRRHSPRTYFLLAIVAAILAGALVAASRSTTAYLWLSRAGVYPYLAAEVCAAAVVLCLCLAVSPSLRRLLLSAAGGVRALWNRIPAADPETGERGPRIPNLDILRAALALLVVAIHVYGYEAGRLANFAWCPVNPVPAFLAVSGLLIPPSLLASRNYAHFAWKRALRILPALACSFAVVGFAFGRASCWATITAYLTGGILVSAIDHNAVVWSLLPEELMYALHAIARKVRWLWQPKAAIAAIIALLIIRPLFAWYANPDPTLPNIVGWFPVLGICFAGGNLLYFYRSRIAKVTPVAAVVLAVVAVLAEHFYLFGRLHIEEIGQALCAISLIVLAVRLPQWRWKWVDASYGIYLWHAWMVYLLAVWFDIHGLRLWAMAFAWAIGAGVLSWFLIERNALALKDVRLFRLRQTSSASAEFHDSNATLQGRPRVSTRG